MSLYSSGAAAPDSPLPSPAVGGMRNVSHDIASLRLLMVNVAFVGAPGGSWVLIDAGLPGSASRIIEAAEARFGRGARPETIILTHGHFDHVGALRELADAWDVLVYAHELELPYLTGQADYPPPDPTVGGGALARTSFMYPRGGIDISDRVRRLPADGSVPHLPGWRWIHTPGHSPGHISLFQDSTRALIAGDAFVTTRQESLLAVATQRREIHGPPMYFTIDWELAKDSVRALDALHPALAVTGHGKPMYGEQLRHGLHKLAVRFDQLGKPRDGRYVRRPALTNASGAVVAIPPSVFDPRPTLLLAGAVTAGATYAAMKMMNNRGRTRRESMEP